MVSPARVLFDSLRDGKDIAALVGRREDLYVDFKQKHDRRTSDLAESDRKNHSKMLSAFANSDGGVVVWGIRTKPANGSDVAEELAPITNAEQFASNLRNSVINTTQPVVDGVDVQSISHVDNDGAGFVKVYVPASDRGPHRAMLAEREYYGKTTDHTYRLEHYQLEDMFGTRVRPLLLPRYHLNVDSPELWSIRILLRNEGKSSAANAGWIAEFSNVEIRHIPEGVIDLSADNPRRTVLSHNFSQVIHPIPVENGPRPIQFSRRQSGKITIKLMYFCDNARYGEDVWGFD